MSTTLVTTAERRSTRNWWIAVLALTLGALVVRVVYILVFRTDTIDNLLPNGQPYVTRVWGDGLVYHKQANLLVDGKGLIAPLPYELFGVSQQSADHPPLYVLYLAIFSALGLRGDLTHMLVSAPIGALTALSFGLLGRRVWSPRVGIIAAAIGAFSPSMIHYPGFILSETISIPLIAAFTLFLYRLWDDPSFRNAVGAGVFLGLAILSRAEVAMVVPVAVIPLVAMLRGPGAPLGGLQPQPLREARVPLGRHGLRARPGQLRPDLLRRPHRVLLARLHGPSARGHRPRVRGPVHRCQLPARSRP
jgi:hypothetical protein